MDNYFHKAVVFTDCHFGRNGDSPTALQDNLDFIDWMIDRARSWGAETCLCLGDWFHNRATVGVLSLHHALAGLERLSSAGFKRVSMLLGNHDIARRQSREVSSLNFARHLDKIEIVNQPIVLDGVALLPWLMADEHTILRQLNARYAFAHLETIGAMMNAQVPCTGGQHAVEAGSFAALDRVFTGHFHKRQHLKNISYIGSIMPFDFSDANDAARGAMFLQWGKEPIYETWSDQPLYHTSALSTLLDNLHQLKPKMTLRATVDVPLRYEDAQEIRDVLTSTYHLRKIELLTTAPVEQDYTAGASDLHTVDQIVIDGLRNLESADMDNERLVAVYNALPRA